MMLVVNLEIHLMEEIHELTGDRQSFLPATLSDENEEILSGGTHDTNQTLDPVEDDKLLQKMFPDDSLAVDLHSKESEIEAQGEEIQDLTPQSIHINASYEGYTTIERDRHFQVAVSSVKQVSPNLIKNERLTAILSANLATNDSKGEKLVIDVVAHLLFGEMSIRKTCHLNVFAKLRDHHCILFPNPCELLAKKFSSSNGIEANISAAMVMKYPSFCLIREESLAKHIEKTFLTSRCSTKCLY
jgi:hypothetical protein